MLSGLPFCGMHQNRVLKGARSAKSNLQEELRFVTTIFVLGRNWGDERIIIIIMICNGVGVRAFLFYKLVESFFSL